MQNRTINILLVGDATEKCHFVCHAAFSHLKNYSDLKNIDFSINAWSEEDESTDSQILAYVEYNKNYYRNQEFAVIYVDKANAKHIEMIEANKDTRWVMKRYEAGDCQAAVIGCLREVASSLSRPFFADVFKGKNSESLNGTLLEQVPAELHTKINNNLHYIFTEECIARKIPSWTTVFRGNKSRNLNDTKLELITTDLHPTINHYLLFQPRPMMELPKEESTLAEHLETEQENTREKCVIN